MRPSSCAFCGEVTDNLLEIFPADSIEAKQAFCGLCLETSAHGLSFKRDRELSNRVVIQTLYRLVHTLLREVRDLRREQVELSKAIRFDEDPGF